MNICESCSFYYKGCTDTTSCFLHSKLNEINDANERIERQKKYYKEILSEIAEHVKHLYDGMDYSRLDDIESLIDKELARK